MNTLLILILVYIVYLFVWFVINLVAYFVSIAFKKPVVINAIVGVAVIAVNILNFLIGIGLFWGVFALLFSGQFLWLLVYIFFGIGLISGFLGFLQTPFILIPAYFAEKVDKLNMEEDIESAEILDEKHKVISKIEGNKTISKRLAKYFIAFYAMNFIGLIIFPVEREGLLVFDFVTKPFLQMIGGSLIIGLPYIIYHKLRYKSFFPEDKRYLFIQIWQLNLYIFVPLLIIVYLLALGTNTL